MAEIAFHKWQGAGNDFIIIDNRNGQLAETHEDFIKWMCDRHFGIGADGLMLLNAHDELDFEMQYFNSDGIEADMCGNGGRCIAAHAHRLGLFQGTAKFMTRAGIHLAEVLPDKEIRLKMKDVNKINLTREGWHLNTGVPHLVVFTDDLGQTDVHRQGARLRFDPLFQPAGTNVNFVHFADGQLHIRTYERGVEAETLACGTGVVASALAYATDKNLSVSQIPCQTRGGRLLVDFIKQGNAFTDIWLTGPAMEVYTGKLSYPY